MQARVLLELDAIDREQAAAPALPVLAAPRWSRLRAFFRGAAVMVPAGATALALFLLVRTGTGGEAPVAATSPAPAEFNLDRAPLLLGSAAADPAARRPPGRRLRRISRARRDCRAHKPRRCSSCTSARAASSTVAVPPAVRPPARLDHHHGRRFWLGTIEGQPAIEASRPTACATP